MGCSSIGQPTVFIVITDPHQKRTKIPIKWIVKACIKFLHHECTMNNIHFDTL